HYASWMRTGGYHSFAKLRSITLTTGEIERFMELVEGRPFWAAKEGEDFSQWEITGEPLKRKLQLKGSADGVELKLEPVFGLAGARNSYYFLNGKVYPVTEESLAPVHDFMEWMRGIPDRRAFIQSEDVPLFCRQLLPALEKSFVCIRQSFDETEYGMAQAAFSFYLDAPTREMATCRPTVRYGEKEYPLFEEKEDAGRRDPLKETEIRQLVSSFCDAYDEKAHAMAAMGDDAIYELLTTGLARFKLAGEVYVSDALKRIQISPTPKVSVGISVSGNLLELRMTAGDMSRAELLEILSRYSRKKKFYRLKNGDFVDISGADVETLAELKEGLSLTDAQMKQERVELPRYRALYLDSELRERGGLNVSRNREFRALIRNMKTVEDNDFEIPPSLDGVLREYQKLGFLWIRTLKSNGFGGILADDMGLGKTLQVIAFLVSEAPSLTLIVSPASLVYNWNSEFARFAPELPVTMVVGTAARRRELIEHAGKGEILLTSYDLLKRDLAYYENMQFDAEVIDEAQFIKNHGTQAAKAVKQIRAGFKLALTGTPVENRLSELWSIFDYLMPGFLYSYPRFRDEIEEPIVSRQSETAMKRLQKMIRPFVLRRLKKDVLTDLPPKIERDFYAKMEGEQQKLYDAHVKRLQILLDKQTDEEFKTSKIQMRCERTRLRQICCDPALVFEDYHGGSAKLETCLELVQNAVGSGHKILLFSQFTTMLARIQSRLQEAGISFYTLTGSTKKEERIRLVEAFNRDDTSVFCISLKAGGTGLNLTAADIVIHYDPWWNLAVQNQATDRAHRIGQEQVVTVYKLLTKGTIEENITKIQEKKTELAEEILGGEDLKSASFSREELMELLQN
ncbi:MAG: DEAD/DEAH box helicase, partial [Clostridiales bacterium]|nr:DEAD/DEAH box helicase [Clostridiales bacterium]